MSQKFRTTRRQFLQTAAVAAAAPYVITSKALGDETTPPASDRIVLAGIGLGSQGSNDQGAFLRRTDAQYVAVCDVRNSVREAKKAAVDKSNGNSDCKMYNDFRELLARPDIDAVHIATPDHWHALIMIEACRNGKDVYCQKPETRTLREGPLMVDAARRYGRVVSGGSQRVLEDYRRQVNQCWSGELGDIKSINVNEKRLSQQCYLPGEETPPDIDWDMWLGPAPWSPYNSKRCSGGYGLNGNTWRSYVDYSSGGMTDWGAHHFGGALFAADLRELQPEEVTYHEDGDYLTFRFPNGVLLTNNKPRTGNLAVEGTPGEKREAKPVPEYKDTASGRKTIYGDWLQCVKTREKPFRDIELAVNTAVVCHMAFLAYELKRNLKWDAAKQEFTGDQEANRLCDRARREPWVL